MGFFVSAGMQSDEGDKGDESDGGQKQAVRDPVFVALVMPHSI